MGGRAESVLCCAARTGDGWLHAGGDPVELDKILIRLGELRCEYGRENDPFEIHVILVDAFTLDGIQRLEDKDATT